MQNEKSNTPFNSYQLNVWLKEHHGDAVAELEQRGLAMEFIDAHTGRPAALYLHSDKALFGFHLTVPHTVQSNADLDPILEKARLAAPGFQQAYDGYLSIYGHLQPHNRPHLPMRDTPEDRSGWRLHDSPPDHWHDRTAHYGAWKPVQMDNDLGDVLARWTAEQKVLHAIQWRLNLAEVVQDPARSTYNPDAAPPAGLPASASAFDMLPTGAEETRYRVWLTGTMDKKGIEPIIKAHIEVLNTEGQSYDLPVLLQDEAVVGLHHLSPQGVFLKQLGEQAMVERVMPEHLNITDEQAALFINMDIPIGMALARNITTESYDMDFSMDDLVEGQSQEQGGLSL